MKTLTVGLMLLLLAVYCCNAMPQGPNALQPGKCCFRFFPGRIPIGEIRSIAKTHESCTLRGFVINTPRGDFCVSVNQKWAIKAFLTTPKNVAASASLPVKTA